MQVESQSCICEYSLSIKIHTVTGKDVSFFLDGRNQSLQKKHRGFYIVILHTYAVFSSLHNLLPTLVS